MSNDSITKAMEAVMRACAEVSDWETQKKLLRAFDLLAEARRDVLISIVPPPEPPTYEVGP